MASTTLHPFDPISADEIRAVKSIIVNNNSMIIPPSIDRGSLIYNSMINLEPPKSQLLPSLRNKETPAQLAAKFPRKSLAVVDFPGSTKCAQVIVNHRTQTVEAFQMAPGRFSSLTPDDVALAEKVGKSDPRVRKRLTDEYKIPDNQIDTMVLGDVWTFGYNGEGPDDKPFNDMKVVHLYYYFRRQADENQYAHPVGFVSLIDIVAPGKVVQIRDLPIQSDFSTSQRGLEIPERPYNYTPKFLGPENYRKDLKPIIITQPEGPSYKVEGNEITWQDWKFRISFDYRTGLNFHYITIKDHDVAQYADPGDNSRGKGPIIEREVLYQMGLSEMVVPYGDPRPPYHRKSAFDMGEYGMGLNANSLSLGCDCVGFVTYFDFIYSNQKGEPMTIKQAVCLHEEDAGISHKHTEYRSGKAFIVRSRRLVVSYISTVTNYEYLFYWYFYQDGTIMHEVKASGELSTNLLAKGATPGGYGTIEFPLINGQYHQHIFSMRMDFLVDGSKNTVAMTDVVPVPGEFGSRTNPFGQGFTAKTTVFKTSKEAITDTNTSTARYWEIQNTNSMNTIVGKPKAYKLVPGLGSFSRLLAKENSYIWQRARFATHSFWVTPYKENQLYAAGFYINQSKGNEGLNVWAEKDEPIENTDVVCWHTFGLTHVPRVEDFPIMPVEGCSFMIKAYNFFANSPAMNILPARGCDQNNPDNDGEVNSCSKCWWGNRRSLSTITCAHKDRYIKGRV